MKKKKKKLPWDTHCFSGLIKKTPKNNEFIE